MAASREGHRTCDAVIVGGGIIGLAAGWRLRQAGLSVIVVERGHAGAAASSAAAGMLAPSVEAGTENDGGFPALCRAGFAMWPDFACELQSATGADVELRTDGILVVVRDGARAERPKAGDLKEQSAGPPVQWLSAREARTLEPALAPDIQGALFFPEDGQVNNRLAVAALVRAFRGAGGMLLEGTPVTGLRIRNGRAEAVLTDAGPIAAGVVVLAAGAWAGALPGWPDSALPPVRPVKGQMAALRPRRPAMERVVWGPGGAERVYLVPRADGRVLIGATVEEAGFDTNVTATGLGGLLRSAVAVMPALAGAELADHWAGLRPGSPDDVPLVGRSPIGGLVWATGHHRNGILLAPLTADAVCRLVMAKDWPPPYSVMNPERETVAGPHAGARGRRAEAT